MWTTTERDFTKFADEKAWFQQELWPNENIKIIRAVRMGEAVYMACRIESTNDVYAAIALFKRKSDKRYSYRLLTEFDGPSQLDAPKQVLDILTPLAKMDRSVEAIQLAQAWRGRAHERYLHRKSIRNLRVGDVIRTEKVMTFKRTSVEAQEFVVNTLRPLTFKAGETVVYLPKMVLLRSRIVGETA